MTTTGTKKESSNHLVKEKVSRVINLLKIDHSVVSLEESLTLLNEIEEKNRDLTVNKLLAEINYLIALEYKKLEKLQETKQYAKMSIDLYKKCKITSLEDSIPILSELLPDHMHEGVVESRLT